MNPASSSLTPRHLAWRVALFCTFISGLCFLLSLCLPAIRIEVEVDPRFTIEGYRPRLTQDSEGKQKGILEDPVSGIGCLFWGWTTLLVGRVAWFANFLYLASMISFLCARWPALHTVTFCIGLLALPPALSSLVMEKVQVGSYEKGTLGLVWADVIGFGPGFYLWIGAIALIPCAALGLRLWLASQAKERRASAEVGESHSDLTRP